MIVHMARPFFTYRQGLFYRQMTTDTLDITAQDTIAAIATPVGCSGIGIIRISGSNSIGIAKNLFRTVADCDHAPDPAFLDQLPSHYLKHGFICDVSDRTVVDEVLLVIMRSPKSYTREDVVEIQSHSGAIILGKILNMVITQGARMAEPGEFTKRAFLNGRIDLSQAEAVADIISAKSEDALKLATTHLTGALRETLQPLLEFIVDLQAELEAGLEFPDEVAPPAIDRLKIRQSILEKLIYPIRALVAHYNEGHLVREGIRLGIIGRPNVGKSSLLNYMIRKDKAIVTPVPGTTRDSIEEQITLAGLPVLLTDTAGLHDSLDPVEIIGIKKTREQIHQSDLILFLIDGTQPFLDTDLAAFQPVKDLNVIVVINKIDLVGEPPVLSVPEPFNQHPWVCVSAKYGHGINTLKENIKQHCYGSVTIEPGRSLVPNLRQKLSLEFVLDTLIKVDQHIEEQAGEELVVMDLEMAKRALNEILGHSVSTDVLDEIFGRFCIGK